MKQCEYCGKDISYHDQYCSDECQIAANQYYSKTEKFAKPFMVVNTVCVFGIPVGIFLMSVQRMIGASVAATSCVVLGIMLLFFPFATDGMIRKFKIGKATRVTRIIGICTIVLGIAVAGLAFFLR